MPSSTRRAFLAGASAALAAAAGCSAPKSSSTTTPATETAAHWVKTYLGERDETHDVTVAVTNAAGQTLFERNYRLSDANEADEVATFPASSDPETVAVTVDGTRFEQNWPGFQAPRLPCEGPNEAGVEVWVETAEDGTPDVRLEADCQTVSES